MDFETEIARITEQARQDERIAGLMISPEAIRCNGCNSDIVSGFCKSCQIKECATSKHIAGCHECETYPCDRINQFPIPLGKKIMLRCVPFRRAFGTDLWEQEELRRYCCPHCQTPYFRGAKKCAKCKREFAPE